MPNAYPHAMSDGDLKERFQRLSVAQIADAVVRLELPSPRIAPVGIRSLFPGTKIAGAACPVALHGYADHVLESIYRGAEGDVLVLDNQGRLDEACFGDLAAYEARTQGLAGVVIWGVHRDGSDLRAIGVPVFSYGIYPLGMQRVHDTPEDPFARARLGEHTVERGDIVFADDDGVVLVAAERVNDVLDAAEDISASEASQVDKIRSGIPLREQLQFDLYLTEKKKDPTLTLSAHLNKLGRHF